MPAPTIYRSSDQNAPTLIGAPGTLTTLLDAILVNGYGSSFAIGTISNDGTLPADGDTVTVGSITYTFKTSLTGAPANSVLIQSTVANQASGLAQAINGTQIGGGNSNVTAPNPDIWTTNPGVFPLTLTARKGGTAGNSLALARTSAGTPHISVSGATLTGGGGSNTKAGAGWTKPYIGSSWMQGVYRQPAGCGFYLQVDDSGPGPGAGREARCCGWETMSAYGVGTNQFPTNALAGGTQLVTCRKSSTLDTTVRSWVALVDDRTFFLFTLAIDSAANYHGMAFGDFYSYLKPSDPYKCFIIGGYSEGSSGIATNGLGTQHQAATNTGFSGHFIARNFLGLGGATGFAKMGDTGFTNVTATTPPNITGKLGFPNPQDGGLYVAPFRVLDCNNPGGSFTGTNPVINLRGRLRGLYHVCNDVTPLSDGDIFQGAGDYAGRTFMLVKFVHGLSANAYFAVETTPWEIS